MPECHKCKYNLNPTNRCIKCKGPSMNPMNHGKIHLSIEANNESHHASIGGATPSRHVQDKVMFEIANLKAIQPPEPDERLDDLSDFMRFWIRLTSKNRNILSFILADTTLTPAKLAKRFNCSRPAMKQRLVVLARKHEAIHAILRLRMPSLRK